MHADVEPCMHTPAAYGAAAQSPAPQQQHRFQLLDEARWNMPNRCRCLQRHGSNRFERFCDSCGIPRSGGCGLWLGQQPTHAISATAGCLIDCLCMLSVPPSQAILFTTARAKGASWCMRAREAGWLPSPPPPVLACRPTPPPQHPILQALPEQRAGQACRSTCDLEAPRGAGAGGNGRWGSQGPRGGFWGSEP